MPPSPGFVASERLGISALGNVGAAPIQRGMHLRWGFDPELGYPAGGFSLFRRDARPRYPARCLTVPPPLLLTVLQRGWAPLDGGVIRVRPTASPGAPPPPAGISTTPRWRRFDVDLDAPALLQRVGLQGLEGVALVFAMLGGRVVAAEVVTAGGGAGSSPTAHFGYPLIDAVIVHVASGGPAEVCIADPASAAEGDWSPDLLGGRGLPLTLVDALARLDGSGSTIAAADFDELRASLDLLVDDELPGRMFDREVFRDPDGVSPFLERPLDLSLLFALDPDMARVAGLYFVDTGLTAGSAYDYLLVGRWTGWQLPEPARVHTLASVPEGTLVPRRFGLSGASLTLPTSARVSSQPRVDGEPARKALLVRNRSTFWLSDAPATVRFAEPQHWVVVELGPRQEPIEITAHRFGFPVDEATVPAGAGATTTILRSGVGLITELEIRGRDYILYGLRALPASAPDPDLGALDEHVALGTLLLGVPFADAPPLSPPTGLRLRGLPMPTSEQPALGLDEAGQPIHDDPQGLGLRWDPAVALGALAWPADLGRRPPTEAVGYELRYQHLGNDDTAGPVDPAAWREAADEPVAVAPPAAPDQEPEAAQVAPGEDLALRFPATAPPLAGAFPADADLWLVPWVPEGWYAAEVRAVDAFGRRSAWSPGGPTLADALTPPPPPPAVEAKLLQQDDPELDAADQALVAQHGDGCIRVSWQWPAPARRQAPRAASFRVYIRRRPFDRVRVDVVSIAPGPAATELTCVVDTEVPLVAGGLVGSNLVDADRTAFRILANDAGAQATLTLRRHVVDAELEPRLGRGAIAVAAESGMHEDPSDRLAWEDRVAVVTVTAATSYEVVVPPAGIVPTRDDPLLHVAVGVATADASPRTTDGREGGVSAPVPIVARLFAPLPEEPRPPRDRLFTTRPDFFGRCHYELRWPNVLTADRPSTGWRVFRSTDRAVFGLYNPDPLVSRIDASGLSPATRTELDAAFPTALAQAVSDDAIRELASQPGAERAFTSATDERLRTAADDVAFVDGVDGKNPVRYLWRMRTEDDAGNLSPFGAATDPVYVPNTYPPGEVKVAQCRGGERQVELSWVPNHEADLAGYLVFSTDGGLDDDAVEGLRLLRRATGPEQGTVEAYDRRGSLVAPVLDLDRAAADALVVAGLVVVTRTGLAGGRPFLYRVAAYDTAGNPSVVSRTFTARTTGVERPAAPLWQPAVLQPDGLHLAWTASSADLNCLVQRSLDGGEHWTNVGGWLGRGTFATVDRAPVPSGGARYRLRVMQPNGQLNRDFAVLET